MPIDWISFSSCCDEKIEVCDIESTDENCDESEDDCCSDNACHCHCYHLTNFFKDLEEEAFAQIQVPFIDAEYSYQFQYSMDSYCSVFRPPLS